MKRLLRASTAAVVALVLTSASSLATSPTFVERFGRKDGLVTNEFAYWSPTNPRRVASSKWELDSGSLFVRKRHGWTGAIDVGKPDARSREHTNSAIFRLTTVRDDFRDVDVRFRLLNQGYRTTSRTPAVGWDGVHVFLRYQDQTRLYYASVNRRDGTTAIKKKASGGTSNGGTYYTLAVGTHGRRATKWQRVRVRIRTRSDRSVAISVYLGNKRILSAVDDGSVGGPPILAAGKTGLRGDNTRFMFDDFEVRKI